MAAGDQEMLQSIEQGHVRPESGGQMHIGRLSGLRCSRVDHDELGPVDARKPIQNSHPEHGLLNAMLWPTCMMASVTSRSLYEPG